MNNTSLYSLAHSLVKKNTDNTFIQLFRYSFVGGFAFLVDFISLYLLTDFGNINYLISASISFILGLFTNYILSIKWVFTSGNKTNQLLEFFYFLIIGLVGLLLNTLLMWFFTETLNIFYLLSKIASTAIVYFWNFFARKYLLFNNHEHDNK